MGFNSKQKKWMIEYHVSFVVDALMNKLLNVIYHTAKRSIKIFGRKEVERWLKEQLHQIDSKDENNDESGELIELIQLYS